MTTKREDDTCTTHVHKSCKSEQLIDGRKDDERTRFQAQLRQCVVYISSLTSVYLQVCVMK